ncbi:MAG: polyprenyl synthetase family protein [Sulfobacillus acidophilus]|uniref:Polyprenyl synthetase family protein n=1 Tax=Sulfobacillus acidophilus TaxID=53633 RepID=A0A2T2WMV4_9FIRM|nr:MAG: polyprenyl synthetase family protein [Sulfobacillus acidophilus]
MAAVDQRLKEALEQHNPVVREVSDYLQQASGKRLRPALVLLAGRVGTERDLSFDLVDVAAAVEMIHMATLVHDDIIDKAEVRRGLPAVRARFSDPVAVLAGDFLFARAFQILASTRRPELVDLAAEVVYVMSTGEISQHLDQGRIASEEAYWRRIEAKTGFFLETCCRLGARASYASAKVQDALGRYGHHIGLAYQVIDDLLDWLADPAVLGKAVGEDLAAGVYTLPIIHSLEESENREELRQLLLQDTVAIDEVRRILVSSGATDYCQRRAHEHLEAARQALVDVPAGPERDELYEVADFIGVRDH